MKNKALKIMSYIIIFTLLIGTFKWSEVKAEPVSSSDKNLTIDKTAEEIGYKKYEITLNIKGTPQKRPIDVILAIDCSDSMGDSGFLSHSSLYYAKNAAKNFASELLQNGNESNNRIAVVKFNDKGSKVQGLTNNLSSVDDALDSLKANGNTNIKDAFLISKNEVISNARKDAEKVIILLSDGVPNRPKNDPLGEAVKEGKNAGKISSVFTVGLLKHVSKGDKENARYVLKNCQNSGYYETDDGSGLNDIYTKIFDEINVAARNSIVTDVLSNKFKLVSGSLTCNKGTKPSYDETQRKIAWEIGNIKDETYVMKYEIEALDTTRGNNIPTNDFANISYTDNNGASATLAFPIPRVNVLDAVDYLKLNKSAAFTQNRDYEVNLSIKGAKVQGGPMDVILIIDTSGSMGFYNEGSRTSLQYAKEAAKSFSLKVLKDNKNRIGIVSFSDDTEKMDFTNDISTVNNYLDGLNPAGGTNIDKAFRIGDAMMKNTGRSSSQKAIVLLTDGVATCFGDDATVPSTYIDGSDFSDTGYYPNYPRKATDATNKAYESGREAQKTSSVFTVGLMGYLYNDEHDTDHLTYNLAVDTLKKSQNGGYYETKTAADLSDIYNKISDKIDYLAKNAVVTDIIPEGFTLVQNAYGAGKSFYVSEGTDMPVLSGNTITWNARTIGSDTVILKYMLRAEDNYYGDSVPTNVSAVLNFKDPNGKDKSAHFNRPLVSVAKLPSSIEVTKKAFLDSNYSIEAGSVNKAEIGKPIYYKFTIKNTGMLKANNLSFKDEIVSLNNIKIYDKEGRVINSISNLEKGKEIKLCDFLDPNDYITILCQMTVTYDFVGGIINHADVTGNVLYKHVDVNVDDGMPKEELVNLSCADSSYVDVVHGELPYVGDSNALDILYILLAIVGISIIKIKKNG